MPDLITEFPRSQTLAEAQPDLDENFNTINDIWGINHFNLIAAMNSGKHSQVDLLTQAAVPTGVQDEIILANVPDAIGNLIMYFVKQASAAPMLVKRYSAGGISSTCLKLPSGIIIKAVSVGLAAAGTPTSLTIPWSHLTNGGTQDIPFTNQYIVMIVPLGADDINSVLYVTDISNPAQFTFTAWQRAAFNTPLSDFSIASTIVAIGS